MKRKTMKKHEQEYIHIRKPSSKKIGSFFLGLFLSFLSFLQFKLLIYKWKELGLDILYKCEENCSQFANWMQLDICFNLVFLTVSILFSIISLFYFWDINWKKLIKYLITGLIGGLIGGLITGLIAGLITGLIGGLIIGLIGGLIIGLIGGLIIGLTEKEE